MDGFIIRRDNSFWPVLILQCVCVCVCVCAASILCVLQAYLCVCAVCVRVCHTVCVCVEEARVGDVSSQRDYRHLGNVVWMLDVLRKPLNDPRLQVRVF